ncbi:MAG: ABC transporter permease [Fimbriimonadaceae bacterium]|jgi:simple sugar transport system permease protein|nr:ABC transporter permease [Fimbriimonadaceae bacterium]
MAALEFAANLLRYAAPVSIAALGESVSQKSGVINIGLEGQMLLAAFAATLVGSRTGNPWLALLAALLVGLVFAMIQGFFTLRLLVDQVVIGTAVNLFALGLTSTLFRVVFGQSGQLVSLPDLPKVFGPFDLGMVLLLPLAIGITWFLTRTKPGLALRGAGEYPAAVESAGYSVMGLRAGAIAFGGALAGLAGGYLAIASAGSFAENMTAGRGFVAIAMVTFGRWKPIWVFGASLLVGAAELTQFLLQAQAVGIPHQVFRAMPYVLALAVLVFVGKGTSVPMALGLPYRREK